MASKNFPQDIRTSAYQLHAKGYSHSDIRKELAKYCKEHYNRTPPSVRTINKWSVEDNWAAQDEVTKANLLEEQRPSIVQEKLDILSKLQVIEGQTYKQFLEQVKDENVRLSPGQCLYGLLEIARLRHSLLSKAEKGPDVDKILKAAVAPLFAVMEKVLGPAFTSRQDEILAKLRKSIQKNE